MSLSTALLYYMLGLPSPVTLDPNVDTNPRIMGLCHFGGSSNETIQKLYPVSDKESVGFLTITPLYLRRIVAHTYVLWNSKVEAMYCSSIALVIITITVMGELYTSLLYIYSNISSSISPQLSQLQWCPYLLAVDHSVLARPTPSPALCR